MQGYIKFKEVDEELYEINFNFKKSNNIDMKNFITYIMYFFVRTYLRLVVKIKKSFHIITVKEIYCGLIFILPFSKQENKEKKLKKCIFKIKKLMKKYEISILILSEELRKDTNFLSYFQNNRILQKEVHILNEKKIMPYLIKEIIEYILQKQGKTTKLEDLYLLIKQERSEYRENIAFLSQHIKTINIVTPCLKNYQRLANQLGEDAIITVTNNKRKSLRKAKWIVNFDMPGDEMKKYTVYQKATIIYLKENRVYQENAFEGIHICRAGIDVSQEIKDIFKKQYLLNQFSITILYESTLVNKQNFLSIRKQMKKDQIIVAKLYGIRGALEEKELKNVG